MKFIAGFPVGLSRLLLLLLLCLPGALHGQEKLRREVEFSIPELRADKALTLFAEQADLTLIFAFDIAARHRANAVEGKYTVEVAVNRLLEGSGLQPVFTPTGQLRIQQTELAQEDSAVDTRKATGLGALIASIFTTQAATAQVNVSEADIEEVIVTAQIREENFQDVAVTGSVFGEAVLDNERFLEMDDIGRFTPGLLVSNFNNSSPNFAVRGAMNTFSQAGASKPVGVFMDDVFIPRNSAAAFQLFDVRQISVLRGPQGTLFGRNVTAGAIQIYTTDPSLEQTEVRSRIGTGNFGLVEASGLVSGPLGDRAAAKLSLGYQQRDGFNRDRFSGQELEDLDSLTLRGSLLFTPGDRLKITLNGDYTRDENGGKGYSFVSSLDGSDRSADDGNIRTSELRVPQAYERDIAGVSAHFDWLVGAGTVQSITAYRQSDSREFYSLGASDVTLPAVTVQFLKDDNDEPTSFSQELRFVSDVGDRLDYVLGAYFYSEETDRFLGDVLLGAGGNARFVDRQFDVVAETSSYALYGDISYRFGDAFEISLGGRYTSEKKEVSVDFVDNNNGANNFATSPDSDFQEFTPRITASWFVNDSVTLFASRTEGFTAGGFNTETNNVQAIELGFEPENIIAYELGMKSQWADDRVTVNATLFQQDYEDKQEGFLLPGSFFSIFNASQATMEGLELELSWAVSSALLLRSSYSYLDATYDEFVIPGGADFSGNRLQQAPEHSFSLLLDYSKPIGRTTLTAGLSYTYQDDYFTGASNIPNFLIDSYSLINGRLGWEWGEGKWAIQAWGKNLMDEDFVRIRGTSGAIAEYFGPPRTYGLTLTYRNL